MNINTRTLIVLLILLFVVNISNVFTQNLTKCDYHRPKQSDQWRFGDNAGIDFNNLDIPDLVAGNFFGGYSEFTPAGVSTISDTNGKLLFYTNGMVVWNRDSYKMINGGELMGNNGATMSALIVPNPYNSKQFYVFSVDMYRPPYFTKGINYSIVDYTNNSNGIVTNKNRPLLKENAQKICAVKHRNGKDYWIITHGFGNNKGDWFYVYLLSDSLNTNPHSSQVGVKQTYIEDTLVTFNNGAGYMKVSPDGSKLALVITYDGYVEIFDFDNATGLVSNPQTSSLGWIIEPWGVEFSPDGSKLYVSTSPLNALTNYIYQFDLNQVNPMNNPFEVTRMEITASDKVLFGALQLAPDGKIYVSKFGKSMTGQNNISVIYNPNRPGAECNFNILYGTADTEFNLGTGNSYSGLPNFPSNFLNIPHFWSTHQCLNDTTDFEIRNTANIYPSWDFKDTGGISMLTNLMKPKHIFSDAKTYEVELTETYDGIDYVFTENVIINPLPNVDIGLGSDTIYILPNSSIRLDAGEGYDIYTWTPDGSSGQYLDVTGEGLYSVSVTDLNCCTNTDAVYIKSASLAYPTAFKPSSSIVENQTFTVRGNIGAIAKYQLHIFNRWGQLIFESDNPTEGWDGNFNGSPAPLGTYVYASVLTSFESGIQSSIDIKNTGTITLIR